MKKEKVISKIDPRYLKGICHRGFHNDKYSENGLKAFENAINNNFAFEFDVHVTKDNEIVVCHDSNLERVTGKKGIIEELTLKDIKDNYRLKDGGEIPTLKEVLDLNQERVPIVCEIKVVKGNFRRVGKYTKALLDTLKDKSKVTVISFDAFVLLRFKGYMRQLLVCVKNEWMYHFRNLYESVDFEWSMLREKRVQKYSKKHFINIWTVDSKEKFDECYDYCATMTFQLMDSNYVVDNQLKKYPNIKL